MPQVSQSGQMQLSKRRSFLPGLLHLAALVPGPQQPFLAAAGAVDGALSGGDSSYTQPFQTATMGDKSKGAWDETPTKGPDAGTSATDSGMPTLASMYGQAQQQAEEGVAAPQQAAQMAQAQQAAAPSPSAVSNMMTPPNGLMGALGSNPLALLAQGNTLKNMGNFLNSAHTLGTSLGIIQQPQGRM